MKKVLILALFGLLFAVIVQAGNVGTIAPDVGMVQASMFVQPVTNFQADAMMVYQIVSLPTTNAGIFLPVAIQSVPNTFKQDAWRNPDWGGSLPIMCNTDQLKFNAVYTVQKIPLFTYQNSTYNRTTHNYNIINYSYGLRN